MQHDFISNTRRTLILLDWICLEARDLFPSLLNPKVVLFCWVMWLHPSILLVRTPLILTPSLLPSNHHSKPQHSTHLLDVVLSCCISYSFPSLIVDNSISVCFQFHNFSCKISLFVMEEENARSTKRAKQLENMQQPEDTRTNIFSLPLDVMRLLLRYLQPNITDLVHFLCTCKRLYAIINENQLWRESCEEICDLEWYEGLMKVRRQYCTLPINSTSSVQWAKNATGDYSIYTSARMERNGPGLTCKLSLSAGECSYPCPILIS